LVGYKYIGTDNYEPRVFFITGEFSISYITPLGVTRMKDTLSNCTRPAPLANNKWLVALRQYDGSNYTVYTGIVGVGQPNVDSINWVSSSNVNKGCPVLSFRNDKFVVANGYVYQGKVVTCTDTAITLDGDASLVGSGGIFQMYRAKYSNPRDNIGFITGSNGSATYLYKSILSGLTVKSEQLEQYGGDMFEYIADDCFAEITKYSSKTDLRISILNTIDKAIGVSRASALSGADVSITTLGGTHDSESGLMIGEKYSLLGKDFGHNISATDVLFDIPNQTN